MKVSNAGANHTKRLFHVLNMIYHSKKGIDIANARVTHTEEVSVILFEMYDFCNISSFQRLVTVPPNWEAIIIIKVVNIIW